MARSYFLGVDGGGTKTGFVLADETGHVVASHQLGTSYYIQIGFDGLHELLAQGVGTLLNGAGVRPEEVRYAFFGLPAYGEDSHAQAFLDVIPEAVLGHHRYRCGNDMICGWAGSLGGEDGINIVAGTGSIGYGEHAGRSARGGGWGEIFSDEGSAHWIAVQGLNAFSRMGDGRLPKGPLYDVFMAAMDLKVDLDICGAVFGREPPSRDKIAAMSQLVARAVDAGDVTARGIFDQAGRELAAIVDAIRLQLDTPSDERVRVSYSGGVFKCGEMILEPLRRHLSALSRSYDIVEPLYSPGVGAILYAARLAGQPIALRADA
ncbi:MULTISPECIES: N-acetylglucosamine kinase [Asticcacaulis]|uniref:N-acetylglucosamine kinase n=1 Tax=Asticcacaulis TaxID=76890 RepID=UPI001AE74866|nr:MULTISPECIES: BadF/BadG/BcrA/BcrD ATPase family protein [Asticcacaulis]MBP2161616.1 N-acetylglucosamine kinase-like BadF-type ATPase [Asticcacaulis solisilvae]MDR6802661.1 N-acetylglucosamine kinase-like BadF-type ATPase [Asticcacaulis sp. BE141]